MRATLIGLLPVLFLTACTHAPEEVDVDPVVDDLAPRGPTPIPARWVNLRVHPQVNVHTPGHSPTYLVAANTNIDMPCSTTTIYFDVIYTNLGNTGAGPHWNRGYFTGSLLPFDTQQSTAAAGAQVVETFTKDISGIAPNVPHDAWFAVDWPDGIVETEANDNFVGIRVTRSCP